MKRKTRLAKRHKSVRRERLGKEVFSIHSSMDEISKHLDEGLKELHARDPEGHSRFLALQKQAKKLMSQRRGEHVMLVAEIDELPDGSENAHVIMRAHDFVTHPEIEVEDTNTGKVYTVSRLDISKIIEVADMDAEPDFSGGMGLYEEKKAEA